MANPIVHWEIMGPDGEALNAFYAELFGWKGAEVPGFESYYLVDGDQSGVGGAVGKGMEQMPSYLTMYVQVEDVDEHLAKAESGGATTIAPKTVVPGIVTFGLFSDPAETWSA